MKVTYQAISVVSGLNMCKNSGVLASNTGACSMSYGPCNSAFLEFCYIACRNVLTECDLALLEGSLYRFHQD